METAIPLFIADVHLGKLASMLRMLGFDTVYSNTFSNAALVNIALEQQCVLLTRNVTIGRHQHALQTFIIIHDAPAEQLKTVLQHFHLLAHIQPFSRCMVCNGALEPVAKETVINELPEKTAQYYHQFWQCTHCRRFYWKGPHYNRMVHFIQKITGDSIR
ncbi:hypothetical protein FC093_05375 [Ilyomonas limi]|uniref:Mut7-C RNAse domain-containing protein n=1 Tax=Ilyomonas limi TaxID=2575867 RepID=A0A4U3L4R5_9BACT|nr:Mut7-C RNAse domain-containing protein [Ilyomonas limi]TKK70181.1 hypothetical protein FC093_05375 [Ilyomonas limi]